MTWLEVALSRLRSPSWVAASQAWRRPTGWRPSTGDIYRDHPTLKAIRAAQFTGRCGACEYADLCGGSRARAYASTGDPLGEDSACIHQPHAMETAESA